MPKFKMTDAMLHPELDKTVVISLLFDYINAKFSRDMTTLIKNTYIGYRFCFR